MRIIELNEEQVDEIEQRLDAFDERHMPRRMDGSVRIGIEEDGRLIAGLDACMTAFRILYVSTFFVDEAFRRKGYGTRMIREMENRAVDMGANLIRLDTFDFQGKAFYESMGYEIAGSYENREDGYSEYFFIKRLYGCSSQAGRNAASIEDAP